MQKFVALLPKEGGVLMQTMADEWIEEGKVIGRQEAVQAMILRLLQRRFASQAALFPYIEQQLTQIKNEESLNQLVDIALEVFVLPDFVVKLQEFVPRS